MRDKERAGENEKQAKGAYDVGKEGHRAMSTMASHAPGLPMYAVPALP